MAEEMSAEMQGLENSIQSKLQRVQDAIDDKTGVRIPDPQELNNIRNLIKAFRREVTTELPKGVARTEATKRAKKYENHASDLRGEIERRKIGVSSTQKKDGMYSYDHRAEVARMADKEIHEVAKETMKVQKNTEQSLLRTLQMGAASSEVAADTEMRLNEQRRQIDDLNADMADYNESVAHMDKQLKQVWSWIPRQIRRKSNKNARDQRKKQLARTNEREGNRRSVNPNEGAAINALENAQRISTDMEGKDGDELVKQFAENDKRTDVLLKAVGDQVNTLKIQAENINSEITSQDSQLEALNNQMEKAEDTSEKIANTFEKHGYGPRGKKKKFGFF